MSSVFISPHQDDAVLFGTFIILQHGCRVVNVLRSAKQEGHGVKHSEREAEDIAAMELLGVSLYEQWSEPDESPDWEAVRRQMEEISDQVDRVFAPAVESGGHEQHNMVGQLADEVFGKGRVTHYLTYSNGGIRSTNGEQVPFDPEWVFVKHAALSCYQSQAKTPSFIHFTESLREYTSCDD